MVVKDRSDISDHIYSLLREVHDPEIPVLSIMDMGVVRNVAFTDNIWIITITPTYSGCPAMDVMAVDIKQKLEQSGYQCQVNLSLSPAWNTDWITDSGRQALQDYGIVPPMDAAADKSALLGGERVVPCPRCNSTETKMISQFGSTACKALFQCTSCLEPFDYFKCLK